jgi:hypothetical protein
MTRLRLLCGLLLVSTVLVCGAGWLWIVNGRKMTLARFQQVKEGMSREEVIRTVGGPPGDYSKGTVLQIGSGLSDYQSWACDDGDLFVRFDDADRATEVVIIDPFYLQSPTLTERIRRWLGL